MVLKTDQFGSVFDFQIENQTKTNRTDYITIITFGFYYIDHKAPKVTLTQPYFTYRVFGNPFPWVTIDFGG